MRSRAILNLRSLIISIVLLIIPLQLGRGNIFASSRSPDQDLKIQKAIEDTNSANEVTNNSIYAKDMVFGDKNAEILLIEYFAPTCAICRNYHLEVFPQIKSKYIDTGKIAYVMREAVGNRVDLDASILARCKGDTGSYLKLIGVTHGQLQKYEKGSKRVSASKLALIAKALDRRIPYFYEGFEVADNIPLETESQRLCIEVARNFKRIANREHQDAINTLVKSLLKEGHA